MQENTELNPKWTFLETLFGLSLSIIDFLCSFYGLTTCSIFFIYGSALLFNRKSVLVWELLSRIRRLIVKIVSARDKRLKIDFVAIYWRCKSVCEVAINCIFLENSIDAFYDVRDMHEKIECRYGTNSPCTRTRIKDIREMRGNKYCPHPTRNSHLLRQCMLNQFDVGSRRNVIECMTYRKKVKRSKFNRETRSVGNYLWKIDLELSKNERGRFVVIQRIFASARIAYTWWQSGN